MIRVRLIRTYHIRCTASQAIRDPAEILIHRLPLIPSGITEIHGSVDSLADAALSGGKEMAHRPRPLKPRKGEIRHAVFCMMQFAYFLTAFSFYFHIPFALSLPVIKCVRKPVYPLSADRHHIKPHRRKIPHIMQHPVVIRHPADPPLFPKIYGLLRQSFLSVLPIFNFNKDSGLSILCHKIDLPIPVPKIVT